MKFHHMIAEQAIEMPDLTKTMKPIEILADPTETMGIYHNTADKFSRFIVTHIPTGYKSGSAKTQRGARDLIARLLALPIDWTEEDADKLKTAISGDARSSVVEIINDYR